MALESSLKTLLGVLALIASAGPAIAQISPVARPHPAPAPELGVGALAVAAVAAAYLAARWLIRRRARPQTPIS
jgi:hypothetical protein